MSDQTKSFYVYAIKSDVSERIYIGHTDSVTRRIKEHNDGRVKTTKLDRPWKIVATELFDKRADARWFESSMKRSKGKREKWLRSKRVI